jgi:hypothetical protein
MMINDLRPQPIAPCVVRGDRGTEFVGQTFQDVLAYFNIAHNLLLAGESE